MKYLSFLMLSIVLLVGCKKDKPAPKPVAPEIKGVVKGKVLPVNLVTEVVLTGFIGDKNLYLYAKPDLNGNFTFSDLTSGNYFLYIATDGGFKWEGETPVEVRANNTIVLPTITVVKTPEPPVPVPGKGSVVGKISPAEAATEVNLINEKGLKKLDYDPKTGIFSGEDLLEGNYMVSVSSGWLFNGPGANPVGVEIKAGARSDVGTLTYIVNEKLQSLSFDLGKKSVVLDTYMSHSINSVVATYNDAKLVISGRYSSGNSQFLSGARSVRLTITLKDVIGPGTYLCDGTEDSRIEYSETFNAPLVSRVTELRANVNTKIVITTFDPVDKRISGTFSGTFSDSSGKGASAQEVTNGVFDVKYK